MNNLNQSFNNIKPKSNKLMFIGLAAAILMIVVVVAVYYFMYFKKSGEESDDEAIDCVGAWSKDTACPVDCGLPASKVMETYTVNTPMENGGIECDFTDGYTREVDCPETDECPVNCVGAWEEGVCPASCEGNTIQEVYNVTVTGNDTGNKCPFEHGALRNKTCPAVPSECNGPDYDSTVIYTGSSMDNYANYCTQMRTEGHCSKENVRRNCRDEC